MLDIRTEGTPNGARITIEIGTAELNAVPDYGLGFENAANLAALAVLAGYISSLGLDPATMITSWGELATEEES